MSEYMSYRRANLSSSYNRQPSREAGVVLVVSSHAAAHSESPLGMMVYSVGRTLVWLYRISDILGFVSWSTLVQLALRDRRQPKVKVFTICEIRSGIARRLPFFTDTRTVNEEIAV